MLEQLRMDGQISLWYDDYVGRLLCRSRLLLLVGQVGLEPTMVKPADLQSAAIATRRLTRMAERAELESDTRWVQLA